MNVDVSHENFVQKLDELYCDHFPVKTNLFPNIIIIINGSLGISVTLRGIPVRDDDFWTQRKIAFISTINIFY